MTVQADELPKQSLMAHLAELRARLVLCLLAFGLASGVAYLFAAPIYSFLVQPLADAFEDSGQRRMIFTGLTEAFISYLRLAMFAGFLASFPVIASQIYLFLAPGLYKHERRALVPYLVAAPALFFIGAAFVYCLVLPAAWKFFLGFEAPVGQGALPIQLEAKVADYLSLVMHLIIAFGISFQLPVVLVLLVRSGLVPLDALRNGRRYAIVLIVTVAAFITPPDVFSQIALSVPLYLLYELSIFLCRNLKKDAAHA